MSRPALVSCRGAPRDLGLDQGTAVRQSVRRRAQRVRAGLGRRVLRLFREDPRIRSVDRDATRHFPHMAERNAGLARGAGVSRLDLAALLARELDGRGEALVAAAPERTSGGALLAAAVSSVGNLVLRRSAPDNDHASIEVARPWLVPALAGVNVHGLAVAVTGLGERSPGEAGCMAPASLLGQDCLQRFDTVEKAVDWCAGRPSGGRFALLLADAAGNAARVLAEGSGRRVDWPRDGVLIGAGPEPVNAALEKACAARRQIDAAALRDVLREAGASAAAWVLLDPAGARLGFWPGDGSEPGWFAPAEGD